MIDNFSGKYFFLSNFYMRPIYVDGIVYPSTEHGYQAHKALFTEDFLKIMDFQFPGDAKRYGQHQIVLREDWEEVKDGIMRSFVVAKFTQHPDLQQLLLDTNPHELVEGNTWDDTYWGVCNGVGQNKLGKLLMNVRASLTGLI